jgi:hypothetical protein
VNKYGKDMLWTRLSLYKPYTRRQETAFSAFGMHVVEQDNKNTDACQITNSVYKRLSIHPGSDIKRLRLNFLLKSLD